MTVRLHRRNRWHPRWTAYVHSPTRDRRPIGSVMNHTDGWAAYDPAYRELAVGLRTRREAVSWVCEAAGVDPQVGEP